MSDREGSTDDDLDPESVELPDRPEGSFEDATTASGQLEGETVDERVGRERPDRSTHDRDPSAAGRIAEEDRPDEEPELVGEVAEDEHDLSNEEAAVHVRPDAPGGTDESDGYVDDGSS